MSDQKNQLDQLISKLKQERDELKLQIHLAGMEAKDDYSHISDKVDELSDQFEPVKNAVEETTDNVFAALGLAGEELMRGFKRVRKAISEEES